MNINFLSFAKILYLSSFCIFILFDYLVRINVFGDKFKYYYLKFTSTNIILVNLTFFVITYTIFYITGAFDLIPTIVTEYNNSLIYMAEGDDSLNITNSVENKGVNVTNDVQPTVNTTLDNNKVVIQNPTFSVNISDSAASKLTAAISSSGGMAAAAKVMQHVPGTPTVKAIAGVATMVGVQAATYGMSKVLKTNTDQTNDNSSNLISQHLVDNTNTNANASSLSDLYPNYPLNLLYDIDTLVNVEVIVVILLINIFTVQYLISRDYSKYIPDNRFGKYLNLFLSRYVRIYSNSNKFIIGLCVCNLIMCIFFTKFFLYCIMNPK